MFIKLSIAGKIVTRSMPVTFFGGSPMSPIFKLLNFSATTGCVPDYIVYTPI